jgi:hypothetical protein
MSLLPRLVLTLFAALLGGTSAQAHNAPGSSVALDFFQDHVRAELRLPLSELELSFRQPLLTATASLATHPTGTAPADSAPADILARVEQHRPALAAYLLRHFVPSAPDRRAWLVTVTDVSAAPNEAIPDLVVQLRLAPPPGAPLRRFDLHYDAIVHEVINHIVFVSVRRDWHHAVFADHPEPLTPFRFFNKSLSLDRTGGSVWLGARHRLLAALDRPPPAVLPILCAAFIVAFGHVFSRRVRRLSRRSVALVAVLFSATPARAHRVDECLQCSFVSIAPDHVAVSLTLAPGIETAPALIAQIDANRDGAISALEASNFARLVCSRLSLEIDGRFVALQPVRHEFPSVADLNTGFALISLDFAAAAVPLKTGTHHVRFRNDHHPESSVYLANVLLPANPAVQLGRPARDDSQQTLAFSFVVAPRSPSSTQALARLRTAAP